jgi:taurine dioxygenase
MDERIERRLTGNCGVEAMGLDVRHLDGPALAWLRRLVDDHSVVVLRGQHLTPQDEIAFAARWGVPIGAPNRSPIVELDSPALTKGRQFGGWHSDMSWSATPPYVSSLYALVVPSVGGDTLFANQCAAYAALPTPLRERIENLRAVHRHPDPPGRFATGRVVHSVAPTIPGTGRRTLFVNPVFTEAIDAVDEQQSRRLLMRLFVHATRPEFTYRHRWSVGDLIVWDNRTTIHYAVADYRERRVMHRITVHRPAGD